MNPNDFRRHGHEMVEWIANYLETVRDRRVLPDVKPGEVFDRLPTHAPDTAEPFEQIMQDFEAQILSGSTLWNHPRFFSYFAISSTPPSILAEFLAAAINQNGILWKSGPALTELEQVTLGWLREWLGLPPEYFGIMYDTASVSTLHALIAARQFVVPDTRRHGARHDLVVYTSDQAHSSIEKGALALGFGEDNVRKIATDENFAIRLDLLEAAIQKDLTEGRVPCCVVACVGATPTASVDPISQVITLARHYGMWIHVDAAYAGPAAMLPECAPHFAGWDHADSIVMNPQKCPKSGC
ncbi:MAG: aminotransferase class I/II-fold pyridoxal phosphate-dependent enzyme [Acidobacteria bacterium]|nr:aminotransferase class I/II-fold pyridoxal phosphate-dependent enzyme [Acidobacteriota bacterium]